MSFRELRDTTEILRSLGYPRLVSIENFRTSNFPLVAEILTWVVVKFEPNARLPKHLDNETERVMFVKEVVLVLLQKAHIRLNPKHLYQSDGHAIRELLPVLRMLYESVTEQRRHKQKASTTEGGDETVQLSALRAQVNAKRQELHKTVKLAAELPKTGASLYELLRDEEFAKEVRTKALGRSLNAAQVEAELRERVQTTEERIEEVRGRLQNIGSDEQELARKIERRRRELDQLQKRLAKLQAFRPPYLDEYEHYEALLRVRYTVYVTLFRNLHALQCQLVQAEHAERERALEAEQSMRVMVEKMRMEGEQTAPAIAGIPLSIEELNNSVAHNQFEEYEQKARERGRQRRPGEVRVFGNMTGLGLSDDEEGEDDDDDDDDDLGGGRIIEIEDEEQDNDDDDDDFMNSFIRGNAPISAKATAAVESNGTKHSLTKNKMVRQHGDIDEEDETEEDADEDGDNSGDNF